MLRVKVIAPIILFCLLVIYAATGLLQQGDTDLNLTPQTLNIEPSKQADGTQVGTGWSVNDNPEEAAKEAVRMAMGPSGQEPPDIAIVFISSGSNVHAVVKQLKKSFGDKTKLFGGTSDSRGMMTDKGLVWAAKRAYDPVAMEGKTALALMTITSRDIVFGIGSACFFDYPSIEQAAQDALTKAITRADRTPDEAPKVILCATTIGVEEEVLAGIEKKFGKNIHILGGTAGGPQAAVFCKRDIFDLGLVLAVIYTDLPIGWTFEGGFDVKSPHSGVVTKVREQVIVDIDQRPALDVYDTWLGGKISRLQRESANPALVRDLLALHPLYRKYFSPSGQEYNVFSHPWPADPTLQDKSIQTSTKIAAGERVYLSHGSWETLLNRIVALPGKAINQAGMGPERQPLLGLGYLCAGVMGIIPEKEWNKIPKMLNYTNHGAPFLASFTWGEQGYLPGIGNKHANLTTSFLVIGPKE